MGSALGDELRSMRQMKGYSLRKVADQAEISTAYLQKLETGDVKNPSPNVLHAVAKSLDVSYARLMELAGYVVPDRDGSERASGIDHVLANTDLTADERNAVAAYVALLRQQRPSESKE